MSNLINLDLDTIVTSSDGLFYSWYGNGVDLKHIIPLELKIIDYYNIYISQATGLATCMA